MKQYPSPPPAACVPAALLFAWRRLRRILFHDKAGDIVFRAALVVRAPLLAALALAGAALLSIPAGEARADSGHGLYALHCAAGYFGEVGKVNHLLGSAHGVDVDDQDSGVYYCAQAVHIGNGYSPLHSAATYNRAHIIPVLISAGADVNAKDRNNSTPINDAIQRRNHAVVAVLISAGADLNVKNGDGHAALHHAANYANRKSRVSVIATLIEAGAHWGEACASPGFVNPAGPTPPCLCESPNVETNLGACEPVAVCAAPSVLNAGANRCDCPAPNFGTDGEAAPGVCVLPVVCTAPAIRNASTNLCDCPAPNVRADGADAPGDCVAASMESCGGLTPAKFYDSAAGECVAVAACAAPAVLNAGANRCDCPAPNVGADGVRAPGHCAAPSAESCRRLTPPAFYSPTLSVCAPYDECMAAGDCALSATACARGFNPNRFYDSAAGECVPFVECDNRAYLNSATNECECRRSSYYEYWRTSGECASSCNAAERAVSQGRVGNFGFTYYKCECGADVATDVNGVCEFLYPCHDSAIRKADNSGCECPAGTFAHGDPSGGERRNSQNGWQNKYGRYVHIPATAECHSAPDGHHAPLAHDLHWTNALDDPEAILHFIADHGRDPATNDDLYTAAGGGHYQAAKLLIENGANVDRKYYGRSNGNAPLHEAVRYERAELITLLLRRGADAGAKGYDGQTPLHLAARRTDTAENVGLIAFLLDKGADPNTRNDDGWRPLDLAYHGGTPGDLTWQARRGIMAALINGGATWSDECTGGTIPNPNYRPSSAVADCVCPLHLSERDSRGACECPAHSHSQVNGRCLPKDSAQVEAEILKMETELLRLRAALVSLNAKLTAAAEMPREMVEEIAEQAGDTAQEIKRRRDNFLALARADLAGAPPPPVAMSDTAAECRMLGGEVQIHSATGIRVCSGIDANDTFCLVDSGDAYPCRGLFRHVRTCNDDYNRRALNPFFCGARCGAQKAVGKDCAAP